MVFHKIFLLSTLAFIGLVNCEIADLGTGKLRSEDSIRSKCAYLASLDSGYNNEINNRLRKRAKSHPKVDPKSGKKPKPKNHNKNRGKQIKNISTKGKKKPTGKKTHRVRNTSNANDAPDPESYYPLVMCQNGLDGQGAFLYAGQGGAKYNEDPVPFPNGDPKGDKHGPGWQSKKNENCNQCVEVSFTSGGFTYNYTVGIEGFYRKGNLSAHTAKSYNQDCDTLAMRLDDFEQKHLKPDSWNSYLLS